MFYDFLILVGYLDSQSKSSSKLISPFRNFLYSLSQTDIMDAKKDVSGLSDRFALVIQALKALGKDNIDETCFKKACFYLRSGRESCVFERYTASNRLDKPYCKRIGSLGMGLRI